MPYELISDGKTVPLGDRKYFSARRISQAWKFCRILSGRASHP